MPHHLSPSPRRPINTPFPPLNFHFFTASSLLASQFSGCNSDHPAFFTTPINRTLHYKSPTANPLFLSPCLPKPTPLPLLQPPTLSLIISPQTRQPPSLITKGLTDHPTTSTFSPVAAIPLQSVVAITTANHRRFSDIVENLPPPTTIVSWMNAFDYAFVRYLLGPNAQIEEPGDKPMNQPPIGGYIGIHLQSDRYGFRVPTTPLMATICTFYRVVPGMLSPNSHQLIACL